MLLSLYLEEEVKNKKLGSIICNLEVEVKHFQYQKLE